MCSTEMCCNSIVLCNSMTANLTGMAASRFLAAAAGVLILCFAAESRRSHCNGGVKVANGVLAADLFHLGTDDFSF